MAVFEKYKCNESMLCIIIPYIF